MSKKEMIQSFKRRVIQTLEDFIQEANNLIDQRVESDLEHVSVPLTNTSELFRIVQILRDTIIKIEGGIEDGNQAH
jgi:hypothetical protein